MNDSRRKRIEVALASLAEVMAEEQGSLDNLPESLQEGDRGASMETNIEAIQEAIDSLGNVE